MKKKKSLSFYAQDELYDACIHSWNEYVKNTNDTIELDENGDCVALKNMITEVWKVAEKYISMPIKKPDTDCSDF
jgi:hypothetical protein